MQKRLIQNSMLVIYKMTLRGGVKFTHSDHRIVESGSREVVEWDTTREIEDVGEMGEARSLRGKAERSLLKLGVKLPCGFVVTDTTEMHERLQELETSIRGEFLAFNRKAQYSSLEFVLILTSWRGSGEGALQMITDDLREAISQLQDATSNVDVIDMREAAKRIKGFVNIAVPEVGGALTRLVKDAQAQASRLNKRLKETDYDFEAVRKEVDLAPVESARFLVDDVMGDIAEHASVALSGLELDL